ncbi:pyridine nucleotide-disulfide oxidoreductase [Streptomyces sp. NPDC047070]|uniref:FAD-dependent oxidoreductase n=1 Tax=Streptomyces sp. NPDC047070 TaxID=3154923 RepID=UPI0034545952
MRRAVVIGAGLGGLLTAAALAPHVDEVIVIERDDLPQGPAHRKGVPQGRHAHLLMPGGLQAIEDLLPGVNVRERLLVAGAHAVSLSSGMIVLTPEGWFRRWRHNDHYMITCSRALLEWVVRTAVMESNTIKIRQAQVLELIGNTRRVNGVQLQTGSATEELTADVLVDTSGRGSRIVQWLDGLGITGIGEKTVDSGLVNATRIYRLPPGAERFPLTMVQANPYTGQPARSAVIVPIEDGRWMVSLAGSRGGEPPADPEGFLTYTLDLPHPLVGQLISHAEPLTDVAISRSTSNARRYLEKAHTWPDGLIVLGDALATFNPAYGQGMSVAALGARTLSQHLRRTDVLTPGLARRVQRAAAAHVESAWSLAVSQDVLYPAVRGGAPTAADRLAARYTRRVMKAATGSYPVASALWDVTGLKAGPARLMRPLTMLAALNGSALPPLAGPPLTTQERHLLQALTHGEERTAPGPT